MYNKIIGLLVVIVDYCMSRDQLNGERSHNQHNGNTSHNHGDTSRTKHNDDTLGIKYNGLHKFTHNVQNGDVNNNCVTWLGAESSLGGRKNSSSVGHNHQSSLESGYHSCTPHPLDDEDDDDNDDDTLGGLYEKEHRQRDSSRRRKKQSNRQALYSNLVTGLNYLFADLA